MAVQIPRPRRDRGLPLPRVPQHRVDVLHGQAGCARSRPRRAYRSIFKRARPRAPGGRRSHPSARAKTRSSLVSLEQLTPSRLSSFVRSFVRSFDADRARRQVRPERLAIVWTSTSPGWVRSGDDGEAVPRPPDANGDPGGRPVIVFVTGGMWIIGYKGVGRALVRDAHAPRLRRRVVDYRNFPAGHRRGHDSGRRRGIGWVEMRARRRSAATPRACSSWVSPRARTSPCTAVLRQSEWERGTAWRIFAVVGRARSPGSSASPACTPPTTPSWWSTSTPRGCTARFFTASWRLGSAAARGGRPAARVARAPSFGNSRRRRRGARRRGTPARALVPWQRATPPRRRGRARITPRSCARAGVRGVTERYYEGKDAHGPIRHRPHPRGKGPGGPGRGSSAASRWARGSRSGRESFRRCPRCFERRARRAV